MTTRKGLMQALVAWAFLLSCDSGQVPTDWTCPSVLEYHISSDTGDPVQAFLANFTRFDRRNPPEFEPRELLRFQCPAGTGLEGIVAGCLAEGGFFFGLASIDSIELYDHRVSIDSDQGFFEGFPELGTPALGAEAIVVPDRCEGATFTIPSQIQLMAQ